MRFLNFLFLSILLVGTSCNSSQQPRVEIIKIAGLKALMIEKNHQIHIINFWATWCNPCVKELPQFIALANKYPEVNLSLVSLDFRDEIETKVMPFLNKKAIDARVLLIDELDYNLWIDLVDPSWSGAIPATLIIEPLTGRRIFLEKEFENNELENEITNFINNAAS